MLNILHILKIRGRITLNNLPSSSFSNARMPRGKSIRNLINTSHIRRQIES